MNNKILLLLFAGLLAIFALSKIFSGKGERTFNPEIIAVDSAKVTSIVIQSRADSLQEVVLKKESDSWTATKGVLTVPANKENVEQLISGLTLVKTSYIAAKSRDKWPEYELEEGKASHLTVYGGGKALADFYIGKFAVNQAQKQITSFFRVKGKEDVYAVEGMGGMMFGQGFNAYRNPVALNMDFHVIEELKMEGPDGYHVRKAGDAWLLDGSTPLDSNKVRDFLINLHKMKGDDFVSGFNPEKESSKLYKTLTVKGSNMPEPVVVRCWKDTSDVKPFIIQSSQYPYSFFASDSLRLYTRIFKPLRDW